MRDSIHFGSNKTGIKTSPLLTGEMLEGMEAFKIPLQDERLDHHTLKSEYILESEEVGDVPPPLSLKGSVQAAAQLIKGHHPAVLIDKISERLAFERSGVRLYDAFIDKCASLGPDIDLNLLHQFRAEELRHFHMLQDVLENLGADPTAQTPCADVAAVAGQGLMQVMNDPRTTVAQSAEALLIAELADNDAWTLLIELITEAGLDDIRDQFIEAKNNEEHHLEKIRQWLSALVKENKTLMLT